MARNDSVSTAGQEQATVEMQRALRGLDYPATRSKLITVAEENGAPRAVIDRLLEFPETADFLNEEQLHRALGVTVHGEQPHGWE